jgi:hypothetical protein
MFVPFTKVVMTYRPNGSFSLGPLPDACLFRTNLAGPGGLTCGLKVSPYSGRRSCSDLPCTFGGDSTQSVRNVPPRPHLHRPGGIGEAIALYSGAIRPGLVACQASCGCG